jgi:hypothetical protein
LQHEGLAGP